VIYSRHQGSYGGLDSALRALFSWCSAHGVIRSGPSLLVYHDEPKHLGVELTWPSSPAEKCRSWVCVPAEGNPPTDQHVKHLLVQPVFVASVTYDGQKGKLDLLSVYKTLKNYVIMNDLTVGGPVREILQSYPAGASAKISVEFQVPVFDVP
jgi:effector-binding domain-containing protein